MSQTIGGTNLVIKRIEAVRDEDSRWFIFESGQAHRPLLVLDEFQMTQFEEAIRLERKNKYSEKS